MAFDRFHRVREEAGIDLIPVMNLFVVLIPFLLLSAAFFHVGVIPTSLPAPGSGTSDEAPDPRQVTVTLRLELDAVHLTLAHAALPEEELAAFATRIERDGGEREILQSHLRYIKQQYDHSDTVLVLPGEGVTYREVVSLLDAARAIPGDGGDDQPLFPVVVLSRSA